MPKHLFIFVFLLIIFQLPDYFSVFLSEMSLIKSSTLSAIVLLSRSTLSWYFFKLITLLVVIFSCFSFFSISLFFQSSASSLILHPSHDLFNILGLSRVCLIWQRQYWLHERVYSYWGHVFLFLFCPPMSNEYVS